MPAAPDFEPEEILRVLSEHQVECVVVGGFAAYVQGSPIPTEDVDVVPAATRDNFARLESGRTSPSLEQVERLLRLCGFQLVVELAPYDDSDIVQAEAALRKTPTERIEQMEAGVAFARELQDTVKSQRG